MESIYRKLCFLCKLVHKQMVRLHGQTPESESLIQEYNPKIKANNETSDCVLHTLLFLHFLLQFQFTRRKRKNEHFLEKVLKKVAKIGL